MKYLFAVLAVCLVLASVALYAAMPGLQSEVPVIYWVTDNNPARKEQVRLYHEWLLENEERLVELGYDPELDGERPVELRLDTGNRDTRKQMIQGVSGVGSDVMDLTSSWIPFFQELGILADMKGHAERLRFGPERTYEAIHPELVFEGGQWGFPCNVAANMLWVNKATFERFDQPLPPRRWTVEEFERRGKAFVEAANIEGTRREFFFANTLHTLKLYRSMGLSMFNETLTASALDDPRYVRALELKRKWTYEDHILPTAAEAASFDTQSGYGGASLQLFNRGNYAMVDIGRYALIQLRRFGSMELDVVEPPNAGYPNILVQSRVGTVYVDGHVELAATFLSYLASETYNMQIVRDGDALPPNPVFTETELFKRPPNHPNEWGVHETFSNAATTIGHANVHSPFILQSVASRHANDAEDSFLNRAGFTAEQAARQVARRTNDVIERNVSDRPDLKRMYDDALERQARIDELKAAGEPIPAELIDNHFLRRYYADRGMLAPPADSAAE